MSEASSWTLQQASWNSRELSATLIELVSVLIFIDSWNLSIAFSSRLRWLRLRFVKLECQKTINIMFCWWCIPFGNLREHSTSTGTDEDSRKGYAMVAQRGFVVLNMATLDTKPADSVWCLSLDCISTTEILGSYHTTWIQYGYYR